MGLELGCGYYVTLQRQVVKRRLLHVLDSIHLSICGLDSMYNRGNVSSYKMFCVDCCSQTCFHS